MTYRLHDALDATALARRYARDGRVQIAPFLAPSSAEALVAHLAERDDWSLVFNAGERVYDVARAGPNALASGDEARLRTAIDQDAVASFGYCFDSVRVPDTGRRLDDPLHNFADFMGGAEVVALLRQITDDLTIAFADAQATRFGPGDFLTAHDDEVAGKGRRAAYVLGLTADWRTEWGGLLLFHDQADGEVRGYRPGMNALTLFAVPQVHSVSRIAPALPVKRHSVTGWLRTAM